MQIDSRITGQTLDLLKVSAYEEVHLSGHFILDAPLTLTRPLHLVGGSDTIIEGTGFTGPMVVLQPTGYGNNRMLIDGGIMFWGNGATRPAGIQVNTGEVRMSNVQFQDLSGRALYCAPTMSHDSSRFRDCQAKLITSADYVVYVDQLNGLGLSGWHLTNNSCGGLYYKGVSGRVYDFTIGEHSGYGMELRGERHMVWGVQYEGAQPYQLFNGSNFSRFLFNSFQSTGTKDAFFGGGYCEIAHNVFNNIYELYTNHTHNVHDNQLGTMVLV